MARTAQPHPPLYATAEHSDRKTTTPMVSALSRTPRSHQHNIVAAASANACRTRRVQSVRSIVRMARRSLNTVLRRLGGPRDKYHRNRRGFFCGWEAGFEPDNVAERASVFRCVSLRPGSSFSASLRTSADLNRKRTGPIRGDRPRVPNPGPRAQNLIPTENRICRGTW
jgi:hypothetical protein